MPPLSRPDRHVNLPGQARPAPLSHLIQLIAVRRADDQHVDIGRRRPRTPSYRAAHEPNRYTASTPSSPANSSAITCRGPNDRTSNSVSGPVSGDSAAVTSRVLPSRRDDTTPASTARAISRWADETEPPARSASSVSDHSRPGDSSTSVSSSACNRDLSNGSNGGAGACITCNIHPTIRKHARQASSAPTNVPGKRHANLILVEGDPLPVRLARSRARRPRNDPARAVADRRLTPSSGGGRRRNLACADATGSRSALTDPRSPQVRKIGRPKRGHVDASSLRAARSPFIDQVTDLRDGEVVRPEPAPQRAHK